MKYSYWIRKHFREKVDLIYNTWLLLKVQIIIIFNSHWDTKRVYWRKKCGYLIPFGNHLALHVSFVSAQCRKKLKEELFRKSVKRIPTFEVRLFWSGIPTSLKAAFASKLLYILREEKHNVLYYNGIRISHSFPIKLPGYIYFL
jgi:hypothetical protein